MWRWDQGRLDYFNYNAIQKIAKTLVELNATPLKNQEDPLRLYLENTTGLPFKPNHYHIWRNYARIFKTELLAARIQGRLVVTDICRHVANQSWDLDDYFTWIIPRTYFPSPAFDHYLTSETRVYPICAIIRFLLGRFLLGNEEGVTLDDLFAYVVGTSVLEMKRLNFINNFQKPIMSQSWMKGDKCVRCSFLCRKSVI
jgi:hypothetical protein